MSPYPESGTIVHLLLVRREDHAIDAADAALSVARRTGLRADTAHPISLVGRAVILLEPCHIVAKVFPLADAARCATEIALATHIHQHKGPVVPPLTPEPGPHADGDVVLSFWEHRPSEGDAEVIRHAAAAAYLQLMPHLQSYQGALPDFRTPIRACQNAVQRGRFGSLSSRALTLLRNEFAALDQLDIPPSEICHLHGDPHLRNLTQSRGETLWLDVKAACTGPREWDLTLLPPSAGLKPRRPDLFALLQRLCSACVVVWCAQKKTPAPVEIEAIQVHLERLAGQATGY